jgi:hypothetical protein
VVVISRHDVEGVDARSAEGAVYVSMAGRRDNARVWSNSMCEHSRRKSQ